MNTYANIPITGIATSPRIHDGSRVAAKMRTYARPHVARRLVTTGSQFTRAAPRGGQPPPWRSAGSPSRARSAESRSARASWPCPSRGIARICGASGARDVPRGLAPPRSLLALLAGAAADDGDEDVLERRLVRADVVHGVAAGRERF